MTRKSELTKQINRLRSEVDHIKGEFGRYRDSVSLLLSACEDAIAGVDGTKSERHHLAGLLRGHLDQVVAIQTDVTATTAIAAHTNDPQLVANRLRTATAGLTIAGITTAGLMTVGLFADVKTLLSDPTHVQQFESTVTLNWDLQVHCLAVADQIDSEQLSFESSTDRVTDELAQALLSLLARFQEAAEFDRAHGAIPAIDADLRREVLTLSPAAFEALIEATNLGALDFRVLVASASHPTDSPADMSRRREVNGLLFAELSQGLVTSLAERGIEVDDPSPSRDEVIAQIGTSLVTRLAARLDGG